jgi:FkbM family methyltransferase
VRARLKSAIKRAISASVTALGTNPVGRLLYSHITTAAMSRTRDVEHNGVRLTFTAPNALNEYRASTFSSKEPETLEWIESMPEEAVLWDIGGNVGLYACYAAKRKRCRVFAFEPSVFNLELLARNVQLNGVTELVTIVPLALSERAGVATFRMTSTEWGGALSTFGQTYGHDGGRMVPVFEFRTIGMSMPDAVSSLGISAPDYIKMDVDGIEHLILKGGSAILQRVKGVLVEINDQFAEQAEQSRRLLTAAGLTMRDKRHAAIYDSAPGAERYTYNQIWSR